MPTFPRCLDQLNRRFILSFQIQCSHMKLGEKHKRRISGGQMQNFSFKISFRYDLQINKCPDFSMVVDEFWQMHTYIHVPLIPSKMVSIPSPWEIPFWSFPVMVTSTIVLSPLRKHFACFFHHRIVLLVLETSRKSTYTQHCLPCLASFIRHLLRFIPLTMCTSPEFLCDVDNDIAWSDMLQIACGCLQFGACMD